MDQIRARPAATIMASRRISDQDAQALQRIRSPHIAIAGDGETKAQQLVQDLVWCAQRCHNTSADQCGLLEISEVAVDSRSFAEALKLLLRAVRRLWTQLTAAVQKPVMAQLVATACDRLVPADLATAVLKTLTALCHKSIDTTENHQAQTACAVLAVLRSRVTACTELQLLDDSNRS